MRTSSYNIYVKLENDPEKVFLVHGYTFAIDIMDYSLVQCLKSINEKTINDIEPETLKVLIERGYITQKTKEEEQLYVKKIGEVVAMKQQNKGNSFLFAVTQDCNFRCKYCYENTASQNGENWSKKKFTKSLVDKAYDTMLKIQPDRSKHNNLIGLYGGEPLMDGNYDIVKYIVEKGVEKGYVFKAITNGYDLDIYSNLLGKDRINALQISIDGIEDIHNKRRPHFKNNDSFSKIINNIEIALNKGVMVLLRINTDEENIDKIEELILLFNQKGWVINPLFHISVSQVQSDEKCEKEDIIHLEKIKALKMKNSIFNSLHTPNESISNLMKDSIKNDRFILPKATNCGATNGMIIFDPLGDIYTCWDKFGIKNHVIGNFKDGLVFDQEKETIWRNRSFMNIPECSKCRYALMCAGGCAGQLYPKESLDLYKPNCQNYPIKFAKAINEFNNSMFNS